VEFVNLCAREGGGPVWKYTSCPWLSIFFTRRPRERRRRRLRSPGSGSRCTRYGSSFLAVTALLCSSLSDKHKLKLPPRLSFVLASIHSHATARHDATLHRACSTSTSCHHKPDDVTSVVLLQVIVGMQLYLKMRKREVDSRTSGLYSSNVLY
jgi:hypothetical protein